MQPRRHAFAFPVVYAGVALDAHAAAAAPDSWFFARNAWALLSVWDADYLDVGAGEKNLRDRVVAALGKRAYAIGRIELVTAPRFFGIKSFNPLNVYYCFDKAGAFKVALLEVNNTFGERHVYVCDEANQWETAKKGFHASYTLDRSFFVSPFNNRSGIYETHIARVTEDKMGVLLVIKDYTPDQNELEYEAVVPDKPSSTHLKKEESTLPKHLIASVEGTSVPLTPLTVLCLLYFHPFTVFLTLPRIMAEAWKIAYIKKLGIYQKPNPRRTPAEVGRGSTILPLPESSFDSFCRSKVLQHLLLQCQQHVSSLYITMPDKSILKVDGDGIKTIEEAADSINPEYPHIYLLSPYLLSRLVIDFHNPSRAITTTFLSGEWSAHKMKDVAGFLRILQPTSQPLPPITSQTTILSRMALWMNRFYHSDRESTFPPFFSLQDKYFDTGSMFAFVSGLNVERDARVASHIFWGTVEVWLSELAFRLVTKFIVDPYDVAGRVKRDYSRSVEKKDVLGSEEAFELAVLRGERDGVLLGEVDDHVDGIVRERVRYDILCSSIKLI